MRVQVILGEAPCMATTWVTEYWQLLLLRTLTGVSIGGALPLVYSLLGDLFFAQQVSVSMLVKCTAAVGALLCTAGGHALLCTAGLSALLGVSGVDAFCTAGADARFCSRY